MIPASRRIVCLASVLLAVPGLAAGCSSTPQSSSSAAQPSVAAAPTTLATTSEPSSTTVAPATTSQPTTTAAPASTLPGKLSLYPAPVPGELPDGNYAVDITDDDLAAVGEPNTSENHGHYAWTLDGGVWSYVQTADNPLANPTDTGTYEVAGDHVKFFGATDDPGQDFVWALAPDGSLQLTYQASTQRAWAALLGSHPLMPAA